MAEAARLLLESPLEVQAEKEADSMCLAKAPASLHAAGCGVEDGSSAGKTHRCTQYSWEYIHNELYNTYNFVINIL